ncbi:hypothetical protein HO173_010359 [Letharia columbiana]|uniref:Uncharacterized protein n=1 Tax=Letharia columbiana TaxID=112416 RepID=A0A8H6FMT6_9LECA|nr:uncharacterized protein HO173_010359 [Letharia columbiana]KAF6231399.1 hypothetical protein HO173_010359 [Letharia columbiana]
MATSHSASHSVSTTYPPAHHSTRQPASQPPLLSHQSDILQDIEGAMQYGEHCGDKEEPLQQANAENIAETVSSSSDTTGLLSTISHQSTQSATQPVTQPITQQEKEQCTTERIAETVSNSSNTTGLLSTVLQQSIQSATQPVTQSATQPEHSVKQEEKTLQQANKENTAEKPSGNKATIVKNTAQLSKIPHHMLSTIPRQIATQQAENDTTIWPAISACLGNITLWYITAMSTQEKDLLRRSQPIGPLQTRVTYRTMHI